MVQVTSADIENRRGRLLGAVFLVLAAFASLSVLLTFLGPDFLAPLQLTPSAARWGVFVLTVGFIALVWEKERQFRQWSEVITDQRILLAAFDNRLKVIENLLETGDRLNAPLALDDVLEVVLEAAVELVDADGGCIDFIEDGDNELSLAFSHSTKEGGGFDRSRSVALPLVDGHTALGWLHLTPGDGASEFSEGTMSALERFSVQASNALSKARILARERAAVAYREAANIVKSRFLATLSHELRTPLTSMLGFSMTLTQHWDRLTEDEKQEFLAEVKKQGGHMAGLLERLLEAARIEIEGVVVHPVRHDVRRSVRRALLPFVSTSNNRLVVNLPDEELIGEVDAFVVDQVVSNLVDNSLRYTDGKVFVSVREQGGSILLSVIDEGSGLHDEKLRRVLDPLRWDDDEVKDGTGLGLHIVGTFVDSHGGDVSVVSDSVGTTISVQLPREFTAAQHRRATQSARLGRI